MGGKNKTMTVMQDQYSPCINSESAFWFHLQQCKQIVISVYQQTCSEHKIRNHVLLTAISSTAGVSASSWPASLETDFSIQGKTSGKWSVLSAFIRRGKSPSPWLQRSWWSRGEGRERNFPVWSCRQKKQVHELECTDPRSAYCCPLLSCTCIFFGLDPSFGRKTLDALQMGTPMMHNGKLPRNEITVCWGKCSPPTEHTPHGRMKTQWRQSRNACEVL